MGFFNFFKKKETFDDYDDFNDYIIYRRSTPSYDYDYDNFDKKYPRNYQMDSYSVLEDGVVFTRDVNDFLQRKEIQRVIFTDAPFPEGFNLVDVSLAQDNSILAWNQTLEGPDGPELCLIISTGERGKGIKFNRACNYMFAYFEKLERIDWNNVIDTSEVISMRKTFMSCYQLRKIDLSSWDVRNVKYLTCFFSTCERLKEVKWFKFDIPKLEDMSWMFTNCNLIKSVDFSDLTAPLLTSCEGMFYSCYALRAVNLANLKTQNQLKVEKMFDEDGVLSVLSTDNEQIKTEFLNPKEKDAEILNSNEIQRKVVPFSEWKIPVYEWDKPKKNRKEAIF